MRPFVLWVIVGVLASCALRPAYGEELPAVKSRTAVVIDRETGAEIFGKDADEVRAIASTTKIFVAMAVRKKGLDLDGWTEITKVDVKQARGGARTRLDIRRVFNNKDLLRAMLMASDNRAPTALGRAAGMSPDELVSAMNDVAKDLQLKRTKFTDPTGLRGNVSTAREMAIALRAALDDDVLREIMGTPYAEVIGKGGKPKIGYGSTNQALVAAKYDVIGGKTGYTAAAGYCFVTGARFHGRDVVMTFLGASGKQTRFADFNRVAEWLDKGAPGGKVALAERGDTSVAEKRKLKVSGEVRGRVAKK
jgi:D-alanyl-D-alanine endopeptidase (penicillin-binding protein 7)